MTARQASAPATAEEITRASKSNLALAFIALPRERRQDINVFYAFCRIVDDLADEPGMPLEERQAALARWRESLTMQVEAEHPLAPAVRDVIARYRIEPQLFSEIIAGCEMDLAGTRYETWAELRAYCYRVASCVGLVSIEIFGCTDPGARDYAVDLGLALQVTNIMRDVAEDYAKDGRIYLPREEMAAFGYSEADLAARKYNQSFIRLMRQQAERAQALFKKAVAELPPGDRRALVAAEIMRAIYQRILASMQDDGFQVFERRYRLNALQKISIIIMTMLRSSTARRSRRD